MLDAVSASMARRTGRSLDEWLEVVAGSGLALGPDVRLEGRSTYVPFVRRRQFAAVAASTASRVDVGLRFTAAPSSPRLQPATAPGQATHKVSLTSVAEVDGELAALLRTA